MQKFQVLAKRDADTEKPCIEQRASSIIGYFVEIYEGCKII